jgi:hypothetical protein
VGLEKLCCENSANDSETSPIAIKNDSTYCDRVENFIRHRDQVFSTLRIDVKAHQARGSLVRAHMPDRRPEDGAINNTSEHFTLFLIKNTREALN